MPRLAWPPSAAVGRQIHRPLIVEMTSEASMSPLVPASAVVAFGTGAERKEYKPLYGTTIPFQQPNCRDGDFKTIRAMVNGSEEQPTTECGDFSSCYLLPIIGCCYMACRMMLIESHEIGIIRCSGRVRILGPGWHRLSSPTHEFIGKYPVVQDYINVPPLSIVRIRQGDVGFAYNKSEVEVLLPGLHVRVDASFTFNNFANVKSFQQAVIDFGPIHFFTVDSGFVRIAFHSGLVDILPAGRYAVNSNTFQLAESLSIRHENLLFSESKVMLVGGISMKITGQLTYCIEDPAKFVLTMDRAKYLKTIENVIEAEFATHFSKVHLEQNMDETSAPLPHSSLAEKANNKPRPVLGGAIPEHKDEDKDDDHPGTQVIGMATATPASDVYTTFQGNAPVNTAPEGEPGAFRKMNVRASNGIPRNEICSSIKKHMQPLFLSWGLKVIELQINRAELADAHYAAEYESSSLTVAKMKANARAQEAKNFVTIAQAEADVAKRRLEVKAEVDSQLAIANAQAQAKIIMARATAEAAELEADGRNKAAQKLSDPFGKRMMIGELDVSRAKALSNLRSLIVQPNSSLIQSLGAQAGGADMLPGAVE